MAEGYGIIDVWMQHPTPKHISQPIFGSLRKWTGQDKVTGDIQVECTIGAMDEAGIQLGIICAGGIPLGQRYQAVKWPRLSECGSNVRGERT